MASLPPHPVIQQQPMQTPTASHGIFQPLPQVPSSPWPAVAAPSPPLHAGQLLSSTMTTANPSALPPTGPYHLAQPLASLGRLAREVAAVRQRARPTLFDAYGAQTKARLLSAGASSSLHSSFTTPSVRDVMMWVLQALMKAQAAAIMSGVSAREAGGSGVLPLPSHLISTQALRDGLRSCGFNAGNEALAVLRSAFRERRGESHLHQQQQQQQHAAIRVEALVTYLCCDEYMAAPLLEQVDQESQTRTRHVRPPRAPSVGSGSGGGSGALSVHLGASASSSSSWAQPPLELSTPQLQAPMNLRSSGIFQAGGDISGNTVSLASSLASSGDARGGGFLYPSATASYSMPNAFAPPSLSTYAAATLAAASPHTDGAALATNVGDWLRRSASASEKENLVAFMGVVADFQARHNLHSLGAPGVPTLQASHGDSLVIPLGPTLKVGLRVYV